MAADTVTKRYIYPPDWNEILQGDGGPDGFRPRVGFNKVILHLTNLSGGDGESKVKKLDLTDLLGPSGLPVVRTVIEKIEYANYGMGVTLYWETLPADVVAVQSPYDSGCLEGPYTDPRTGDGTDGTGDLLLSTIAHAANDSYDLKLTIKLKEAIKPS